MINVFIEEMSKLDEPIPELHLKMCKKIAQLTKVIYQLHTKNEEHEVRSRELTLTYEQQIEEVLILDISVLNLSALSRFFLSDC